jgi:maltodextrin utilization protein YvdJ
MLTFMAKDVVALHLMPVAVEYVDQDTLMMDVLVEKTLNYILKTVMVELPVFQ